MKSLKDFSPLDTSCLFSKDQGFQDLLSFLQDDSENDRITSVLKSWEKNIPKWNELADEVARPEKFPRIERFDRVGNRIERIILPLETKTIRREVVESGIFLNRSEMEKFSKIYLLAQMGEAGVTCPLACTDGLIRLIQALGSDFLKKEYLPKLLSAEYPLAGAQFITEQSGGSDVGAIDGTARQNQDGTWSITAEKWYCSAVDEFFAVLARPEGALQGTEGLSIFFVPRVIEAEGRLIPNNLSIRRLKNKLGTQSLPTAEIDFEGSKAYLLGKKEEGFHNLMNYVLNISRIHNAANSLAVHRRAFVEARNYAEQRVAFGDKIINYPLVQQHLISMLAHLSSKRNLYFSMLKKIDENGLLPKDNEQRLWQRFLINLMKYRTACDLTERVKEAILVFGANGIIEDFSVVPRLLRDSLIVETWEGPHNILCLQILRDGTRFDFFGQLRKELNHIMEEWPEKVLQKSRSIYLEAIQRGESLMNKDNLGNRNWIQTHARRIVDHFANLLEIGNLVLQGVKQKNNGVLALASYLTHESFQDSLSAFKNPLLTSLETIGLPIIREQEIECSSAQY